MAGNLRTLHIKGQKTIKLIDTYLLWHERILGNKDLRSWVLGFYNVVTLVPILSKCFGP